MKKYLKWLLCLVLFVGLCGCSGNFAKIDLQNAMELPENGVIEQRTFEQIRKENAIAVFNGTSNEIFYEWTVFGSDITECRDINFLIELEQGEDEELQIVFAEQRPFGFPALLSIHLNDIWDAQSATVYHKDQPVSTVSITGTKETILNVSVNETLGTCTIVADAVFEDVSVDEVTIAETAVAEEVIVESMVSVEGAGPDDSYLSAVTDRNAEVYVSENTTINTDRKDSAEVSNKESDVKTENKADDYLSAAQNSSGRVYSNGKQKGKDKYNTDPVPEGKPLPVEPENQEIDDEKTFTCTFSIECSTILNNLKDLDPDKLELVPSNGVILKKKKIKFSKGESVFDVLQRVCQDEEIHMEASWTPIYNSAYIEGIHNLYEFDCGNLSGWMYRVNGWYPNYGCSRYQLENGDVVEWRFTCDLGKDIGGSNAIGN